MYKVRLKELLVNGKFGPISPFMLNTEVQEKLGKPEGKGKFRGANGNLGEIWKYSSVQLSFINKHLHQIMIDFQFFLHLPSPVVTDGYFPTSHTTYSEFVEFLEGTL